MEAARVDGWLAPGKNPRDAKVELAKILIAELHGAAAAEREAEAFKTQFSKGEIPADAPTIAFAKGARDDAIDATNPAFRGDLTRLGEGKLGFGNFPQVIAQLSGETASAARQLMSQKAVDVDGAIVADPKAVVWLGDGAVLRVGKRRYYRIRLIP
jgi:tyrosyl-tRNA synthetase